MYVQRNIFNQIIKTRKTKPTITSGLYRWFKVCQVTGEETDIGLL